jgi:hypothetical protein
MPKIRCFNCGAELEYDPNNPYCPVCGAAIPPALAQPQQTAEPPPPTSAPHRPQRFVIYAVRRDGTREKVAEVVESGPEVILGRRELAAYAWRDPDTISRVHVKFRASNGKLYIRDDGSTNGTYVDGEDIRGRGDVEMDQKKEILLCDPADPVVKLVVECL